MQFDIIEYFAKNIQNTSTVRMHTSQIQYMGAENVYILPLYTANQFNMKSAVFLKKLPWLQMWYKTVQKTRN